MASPVDEVDTRELRRTHFEQLLSYANWMKRDGTYYGNKKYFDKRHSKLIEWLEYVLRKYDASV